MTPLRECPFCGGTPRTPREEEQDHFDWDMPDDLVCCSNDGTDGKKECHATYQWFTREEWNTRPIEDALRARIRELEEKFKS